MTLRGLDLFSGIGGISYAVKQAVRTVAYCEIDEKCQAVLRMNMDMGRIHKGLIIADVTKIQTGDLPARIDIILAGFPCQDVSQAGKRAGVSGERTGTIKHVLRLLRDLPNVKYVFLENVANIANHNLASILKQLRALGFAYAYGFFQANEVGALHARKRWFLFGTRAADGSQVHRCKLPTARWDVEPDRLVPYTREGRRSCFLRYHMLGNSVVPQCVAHAWNVLTHCMFAEPSHVPHLPNSTPTQLQNVHILLPHVRREMIQQRSVSLSMLARPLQIASHTNRLWATPTASFNNFYNPQSSRGFRNLNNQIYHEHRTVHAYKMHPIALHFKYDVNPIFWEWIMGYPENWTRVR